MRRWMWTVFLSILAAVAAARIPPSPWRDVPETVADEVDPAFWIDAVDCGMG